MTELEAGSTERKQLMWQGNKSMKLKSKTHNEVQCFQMTRSENI